MTPKKFDQFAQQLFGDVLESHGFSSDKSRYCVFYRFAADEACHVVAPDLGAGGNFYDVKVFATSPAIESLFDSRFPDDLGIPSDLFSYLHSRTGVGPDQEQYHCRTEEGLRRNFGKKVKPSLIKNALPYLDGIRSVSDMIPFIKSNLYLGLALHHVGRTAEAGPVLQAEKERLAKLDTDSRAVKAFMGRIEALLEEA